MTGVPLLVPNQSVIGCYHPSNRAFLLRTQMLVSHTNIITWDVFLRSLLSCLTSYLLTSKGLLRHQPERAYQTRIPLVWSRTIDTASHIKFLYWLGPSHQQDDIHWVPTCFHYKMVSIGFVRTRIVLLKQKRKSASKHL